MIKILIRPITLAAIACLISLPSLATETNPNVSATISNSQVGALLVSDDTEAHRKLLFSNIAPPPGSFDLRGVNPTGTVEFTVRRDRFVSEAILNLFYTPSSSLLPVLSQLKVYLNDELMDVIPVERENLGRKTEVAVKINPMFLTDFNRMRFEFIGHYRDVCENPANTTLWLNIGKESFIDLTERRLKLENNLAFFPSPFFDKNDSIQLRLPFIFASHPEKDVQEAAGILASWFGVRSQWRGQTFPVAIDHPFSGNGFVFLTNSGRPEFLSGYPKIIGPQIELIDNPIDPYGKLLLIAGRDGSDILTAARAIATGDVLFTGSKIAVRKVEVLNHRKPYDAPAWVRTDRKVIFRELQTYQEQLQSSGLEPLPIQIPFNLPPDLYAIRNTPVDINIRYRYTSSPAQDASRMAVSLNNEFLQAFSLVNYDAANWRSRFLHIPVLQGLYDGKSKVGVPALRLGTTNSLKFSFNYTNPLNGGTLENCITTQPVPNHVVIDDNSTMDFSKYHHFIAMPDLHAFAAAAFPFSRMADLSETVVVLPEQPSEQQLGLYLDVMGNIGAQTGLPALNVSLARMSSSLNGVDADLLIIGSIPRPLTDDKHIDMLVSSAKRWIQMPMRSSVLPLPTIDATDRRPEIVTDIEASGSLGAVIGFASPFAKQRSVVALVANDGHGFDLLKGALNDSGERDAIFGSVAVVRDSGVNSLRVGSVYYVGHLPWYERVWFILSIHPVWMSLLVIFGVVCSTILVRRAFRNLQDRRLG